MPPPSGGPAGRSAAPPDAPRLLDGLLLELRRVSPGRDTHGGGWIGLRRNGDHTVTGIVALPLLPPWLALPLVLGAAVLAWRREGR
jgi:hypothetical protein